MPSPGGKSRKPGDVEGNGAIVEPICRAFPRSPLSEESRRPSTPGSQSREAAAGPYEHRTKREDGSPLTSRRALCLGAPGSQSSWRGRLYNSRGIRGGGTQWGSVPFCVLHSLCGLSGLREQGLVCRYDVGPSRCSSQSRPAFPSCCWPGFPAPERPSACTEPAVAPERRSASTEPAGAPAGGPIGRVKSGASSSR